MRHFLRRWGLLILGVAGYWAFAAFRAIGVFNYISTHGDDLARIDAAAGGNRTAAYFVSHEASRIAIGTIVQFGVAFVVLVGVLLLARRLLNTRRHLPEPQGRFL